MAENTPEGTPNFIELAGDITIAWLQNPNVNPGAEDVPAFLRTMHAAIAGLGGDTAPEPETVTHHPAVSVRSSIKPDHLVSLIDGKKYKTLKRHLAGHGLTPDDYRARYGLKADYPMVAESYTAQRREIAERLGLGRKRSVPIGGETSVPDGADTQQRGPAKQPIATPETPAKPKRAPRAAKQKNGIDKVEAPLAAPAPAQVEAAAPVREHPKRSARKTVTAVARSDAAPPEFADPVIDIKAPSSARSRRTARPAQSAVDGSSGAPAAAPLPGTPAKPKRVAASKKPADTPKVAAKATSAKAQSSKAQSSKPSAKPSRVKKAAADIGDALEG